MACRFLESFDYYTSDAEMTRKWTALESSSFVTIDGATFRTGINSVRIRGTTSSASKTLDNQASWVIGFGFRAALISASNRILEITDNATVQCSLYLNANGTLSVTRGTTTNVTDGDSSLSLSVNAWYYIEMKVTIADSIGASTCQVQVNGSNWITVATGQDLKVSGNATADKITIRCTANVTDVYFDDLYIFDGTGSDNNDFAGDVKVAAVLPDGNGATSDFVGSDADSTDNYLHVDETDTDDDTSYTESSTVTDVDLYTFANLPSGVTTVHAVGVNFVAKKDDSGGRVMRAVTRPVSTNFFGDNESPSNGAYLNFQKIYDLNPETAAAWTQTLFDATEFGVNIQA